METQKRARGRPAILGHLSAEERLERIREQSRRSRLKFYYAHKKESNTKSEISAEERLEQIIKRRRELSKEYYQRKKGKFA